jgi:hypothetical protein
MHLALKEPQSISHLFALESAMLKQHIPKQVSPSILEDEQTSHSESGDSLDVDEEVGTCDQISKQL